MILEIIPDVSKLGGLSWQFVPQHQESLQGHILDASLLLEKYDKHIGYSAER